MKNNCLHCHKIIEGRVDKRYCDSYCKSAYQYHQDKVIAHPMFIRVTKQLKLNRRLLKQYNKSGKSYVIAEELNKKGFDKNFFTHYWKNNKGEVYLFCYEFGFLLTEDNFKNKYVLVTWQDYMNKSLN